SHADDERIYNAINPLGDNSQVVMTLDDQLKTIPVSNTETNASNYRTMGYGASRLDMGSERSTTVYRPASSLFESQVLLGNIEKEGLSRWYFKKQDKAKFDKCVDIFKQLMPNLAHIIVDDNSEVWYIEKDDEGFELPKIQFKDLASGYQNIISMIGDIILNLNAPIKSEEDPCLKDNMRAIVLIDELELYLHPKWQKRLPQLLTDLFPNVLFITSTHSPIPLLGAPKNSAFFTEKNQGQSLNLPATDINGQTAHRIDKLQPFSQQFQWAAIIIGGLRLKVRIAAVIDYRHPQALHMKPKLMGLAGDWR
ncbi:MAG: hypothetical protein ACI8WB_006230, partial [Phenylobacterium sp.]